MSGRRMKHLRKAVRNEFNQYLASLDEETFLHRFRISIRILFKRKFKPKSS